MSRTVRLFLQDCGVICALGRGKAGVAAALFAGRREGLTPQDGLIAGRPVVVGAVSGDLPAPPPSAAAFDCRNNRLMLAALTEIAPAIEDAIGHYGRDRVAVVLGTSTSGIAEGEAALAHYRKTGAWPEGFHYRQQETGGLAAAAALAIGVTGPAYTVATACSSSAKVFASARRLIRAGIADAVVVGGADSLCRLTLNGFGALEALSKGLCNPFSVNRDGITIGEGAAAFLLSADPGPVELLGLGETSDAHHPTAPAPDGEGARQAMVAALADAGLAPADIAYVNLHGTATPLNDAMESRAMAALFPPATPLRFDQGHDRPYARRHRRGRSRLSLVDLDGGLQPRAAASAFVGRSARPRSAAARAGSAGHAAADRDDRWPCSAIPSALGEIICR